MLAVAAMSLVVDSDRVRAQRLEEINTDYLESDSRGPNSQAAEAFIIQKTNSFREQSGLERLKENRHLGEAASYFASYMARSGNYGHRADGNKLSERVALYDYDYCIVAENIAFIEFSQELTANDLGGRLYLGWKDSKPHRRNMLDPDMTETGVAVAYDSEAKKYYGVQLFGRPRSAAIRFRIENLSSETLRYTIAGVDRNASSSREFEILPRSARIHSRCRPSRLDWAWTGTLDNIAVQPDQRWIIRGEQGNIQVDKRLQSASGLDSPASN